MEFYGIGRGSSDWGQYRPYDSKNTKNVTISLCLNEMIAKRKKMTLSAALQNKNQAQP